MSNTLLYFLLASRLGAEMSYYIFNKVFLCVLGFFLSTVDLYLPGPQFISLVSTHDFSCK